MSEYVVTPKMWSEYQKENADLRAKIKIAKKALSKINDIRNSIVGVQTVNWSEHIYPLVAALNEAGVKGLPYPEAKKKMGTLIERINEKDKQITVMCGALEDILRWIQSSREGHAGVPVYCPGVISKSAVKEWQNVLQSTPVMVTTLVEALEFYADDKNYQSYFGACTEVNNDEGEKARDALTKWKGKNNEN